MHIRGIYRLLMVAAVVACSQAAFAVAQSPTNGIFVDSSGERHSWYINESRALIWESEAYLPAGVGLTSAYLSTQTDETWQKDAAALDSLKASGIMDVMFRGAGPATSLPALAWQKLIDYAEQQGFNYGIELNDGPANPAVGFIIAPRRYKLPKVTQSGSLELPIAHAQGGFFVLVDSSSGAPMDSGGIKASNGKVSLKLNLAEGASPTLLVFPLKEIATGHGSLPDVWQGSDEYRDRLMDFFSGVKFGPGFRFFYAPFASGAAPVGEAVNAIPNSQNFRIAFEGWLSIKYHDWETLSAAWGMGKHDSGSIEQAARLIPLWWDGRGLPVAYDRSSDAYIEVEVSKSAMWKDIIEFRNSSIQSAMNAAADALKRKADVPVVFAADSYNTVYANNRDAGGFDGLAAVVSGDSDQDPSAAGQAYALTFDAAKGMWFIGMASGAEAADTANALAQIKGIGAKGFFARVTRSADDADSALSTIVDFAKTLSDAVAGYSPAVLFYPQAILNGARVKKLDEKTWWLPTYRPGQLLQIGDKIFGYTLAGDMRSPADTQTAGDGVALFSNNGLMKVTIRLAGAPYSISEANRSAVQVAAKKESMTVQLSESPVVIYGLAPDQLFPVEIAQSEISLLQNAVTAASQSGANVSGYAASMEKAKMLLEDGHPLLSYQASSAKLQELAGAVSPYVWIEGEAAKDHNFDGIQSLEGASGAQYLKLSTMDEPPLRPYTASYVFVAPSDGNYDLWVAGTPPGRGTSDLQFAIDSDAWQPASVSSESAPYVDFIEWFKAGSVNLTQGQHTLNLMATRTSSDVSYKESIDALLLTKQPFTPNGTDKPPFSQQGAKKAKR